MCGIAGVLHRDNRHGPPSLGLLRSMVSTIRHRGPDEYGYYRDGRAGFAHARLSLIDLTTGQQPLANEDENLWIIFNGEIFNYVELRAELVALGHRFRTQSDTEVIVHAYEAWGEECFRRFNGQWAVALWDSVAGRLILSRDRIGVRPLFICERPGRVLFASEVKAIFADPSVPRQLDPRGLDQTLTYWASVAPVSLYAAVEELPPGSTRTYEPDGTRRERRYWRPAYPEGEVRSYPLSINDATEALREKLEKATALRMLRADVPVGSYLSGGLDSSVIAWLGRQAKEGEFRTFSLRFEDAEFDETGYQRLMASTLDSRHNEIVVSRRDIARVFPDVIRHTERPILRTAPAPMFLLSRSVRDAGIKAVLTGEGADEMLAGYDIFREAKIREFWSRDPASRMRPRLFERLYPYLARSPQQAKGMAMEFWKRGLERAGQPGFTHDPRWSTTATLKRFYSDELRSSLERQPAPDPLADLPAEFTRWDLLHQGQYLEVVTLLSSYLISSQGDRMLMAHSVEGRFPFLDADVMEFCNALPPDYKLAILDEKHLLKRMARGIVPEEILRRKKQAYRAPDAVSFVSPDAPEYVSDMFSERSLRAAGMFEPGAVRALYAKCRARAAAGDGSSLFSNTDNMAVVGILSAQLMYHICIASREAASGSDLRFTTAVDRLEAPAHQALS